MLSARGDLKKADDEISEATNSKRILGWRWRVTRPRTGKPNSHFVAIDGKSDANGRRSHNLPCEISGRVSDLATEADYQFGQPAGRLVEKSAEAVVAEPGEGPNFSMQGAVGEDSRSMEQQKRKLDSLPPQAEGEPLHRSATGDGDTGTEAQEVLQSLPVISPARALTIFMMRYTHRTEPPYTSKYVRWCGRTGFVRPLLPDSTHLKVMFDALASMSRPPRLLELRSMDG